jgi:uncharacterized protein
MGDATTIMAGERVRLLPERALFWEREATLVVADLHWGKAASFRAAGIPIPPGTTTDDLRRLETALVRTSARRLFLLGDLFHARAGREALQTLASILDWRRTNTELEILLVRGNHDRHAGDPPAELGITVVDAPHAVGPFELRHFPAASADGYTLAGHVHPAYVVCGAGRQWERLSCFVVGTTGAILPAFGSFTGTAEIEPRATDRVFVVAGDDVIPIRT